MLINTKTYKNMSYVAYYEHDNLSGGIYFTIPSPEQDYMDITIQYNGAHNFTLHTISSIIPINTLNYKFIIQRAVNTIRHPSIKNTNYIEKDLIIIAQKIFNDYIKKEGI